MSQRRSLGLASLATGSSLALDLLELTKPRIGSFVVFAAWAGGAIATRPESRWLAALGAGIAVGLVGAGASVFNQVLERELDQRMLRTRSRPLPAGRLSPFVALIWGAALAFAGTLWLALGYNLLAALLGLGTLIGYALIYTPMKRVSSLNTAIGAIPGAMPPLLGYAALAGRVDGWGWHLFAMLFVWQFPHFLAIAWLHREDYARAGMRMLPSLPHTRGMAGRQALCYALAVLPVSLWPSFRGEAGLLFSSAAVVLGALYVFAALLFALDESPRRARGLLWTSLVYLPLLFGSALLDPNVRTFASF